MINLLPLDDDDFALVVEAVEAAAREDEARFSELAQWLREEADEAARDAAGG